MRNKHSRAKRKLQVWNTQNNWACALEEDLNPFFKIEVLENKLTKAIIHYEATDLALAYTQAKLGQLLCQIGAEDEGIPFLEAALDIFQLKLEFDDPDLIYWQVMLADIYLEEGEDLAASWLLKDCIKVVLLNDNEAYPELSTLQWKLVKALQASRLDFELMELLEELLEMESLLAEGDEILKSEIFMAKAYRKTGMLVQALKFIENLISEMPGMSKSGRVQLLRELSKTYSDLGCHKAALELQFQVYAIDLELFGPDHLHAGLNLMEQAKLHLELGQWALALKKTQWAYPILGQLLGLDHPKTKFLKEQLDELSFTN